MKILWFAHRDITHPRAGGAERTIYEVGKRLVKKGNEVTVVSVMTSKQKKYDNIDGIKFYRFLSNFGPHLVLPFFVRKDFDIVVDDLGHAVPWGSNFFTKKPVVVFFRHLHARSLKGQVNIIFAKILSEIEKNYKFIYPSQIFVTESDDSINDLKNLGINEKNIYKIPPGVDTDLFHPREKYENPTFVYFGGHRDYKRSWLSVDVFKKVLENIPNSNLIIIGDGPSLAKVKERAKDLNILNKITFTGRIDKKNLSEIVSKSWINMHFSVTEGWGLSIMEASAAGTYNIAFDVPGVRESIKNGINGTLIKNNDIDEFANYIIKIIKENNINGLQRKSREYAMNFSWDKSSDRWEELFKKLV